MQALLVSLSILMVFVVSVVSGVWVVAHRADWWVNALWALLTCILIYTSFPYELYFHECAILFLWLFAAIQFMPRSLRSSSSGNVIAILVAVILGAMMILRQDAGHGWATVSVGGLRLELAFAGQGAA